MLRRPWLRNHIIQHLAESEIYHDYLSTSQWNSLMTVACNYIQNDEDMQLIDQLESAVGIAFGQCIQSFNTNRTWQTKYGDQIVTWIRLYGN